MSNSSDTLGDIMSIWKQERPIYEELTKRVEERLKRSIKREGVFARVIGRVKDDKSLAAKLIERGVSRSNYDLLSDRSGVRIICRFRQNVEEISEIVKKEFDIIKIDDKKEELEPKTMGYRSIHFDARLKKKEEESEEDNNLKNKIVEIQLRTLCEDAWAEIQHQIGYKGLINTPKDVARFSYCLGGLFEVADNSFSSIYEKILVSAKLEPQTVLAHLEYRFLRLVGRGFNREFSFSLLELLLPLVKNEYSEFMESIDGFINYNLDKYKSVLNERENDLIICPYFAQPEIFVILFFLEKDPYQLVPLWESRLPLNDLKRIATWWGNSIDDIVERFE